MSRALYALLLILSSALFSFIVAAVLGSFMLSGEQAQGAGLYWLFSLPAMIVVSVWIGFQTFQSYSSKESVLSQMLFHALSAAAAAAAGLAITVIGWTLYIAIAS